MTEKKKIEFADLMLSEEILSRLQTIGFTAPTDVQIQVIPQVFMGRDVVACAQTGTGKTASFALPVIDLLKHHRSRARMPRMLTLVPTRELAQQVVDSFALFAQGQKLTWVTLIGGTSIVEQEKQLDRGVDIIVATPGRLIDLIERGRILFSDLKFLVIDEADRMLDMGFIPDIERIFKMLPSHRQTLLFSATMPEAISKLIKQFLEQPKEVFITPQSTAADTIEQCWISASPKEREAAVQWLVTQKDVSSAFVFCNRKKDVDLLAKALSKNGLKVMAMHGDMSQLKRQETLDQFRKGDIRILVASDIAARGLDIQDVSHVINVNIPVNFEDYVHRIGRTGRAGKNGCAVTIVTPDEEKNFARMKEALKITVPIKKIEWEKKDVAQSPVHQSRPQASSQTSRKTDTQVKTQINTRTHAKANTQADTKGVLRERIQERHDAQTTLGFGEDVPAFFRPAPKSVQAVIEIL